ncbi:FecR family protein [Arenibacter sp. 6A1]|uniref:FecR family protein n=1 Tax=Arenibacter sp. 6A1 TaxID=2720391 RepID=UPI00144567F3|nr:FecR domain-containing protein [Arenibacter sp. 6A1]NKI25469.1 FecR family protein [Arenibacter sp. 6A1]
MEFKLIIKKINNTLNQEEEQRFQSWYQESEKHRAYFSQVKENYGQYPDGVDLKRGWEQLATVKKPALKTIGFWKYSAAAAVVLLLISIAFFNKNTSTTPAETPAVTEVTPVIIGTDKAILTLDNGEQIVLEKGNSFKAPAVSSNGETLIYKDQNASNNNKVAYNTVTIPRGGQFFITLSDGTKVWLNSDSQLRYPVNFTANAPRKVSLLYGEAYFEVSPSTAHNGAHFMVATKNQEVEVLGTQFNIKAYKEDTHIATTLVEGKVLINNGLSTNNLKPGQQATLEATTNQFSVKEVDINNEISWKNGFFSFKEKPLNEILQVLSRWYDVDFIIENKEAASVPFNGVFNKKQALENILSIIENTNEAKFKTVGKTIVLQ